MDLTFVLLIALAASLLSATAVWRIARRPPVTPATPSPSPEPKPPAVGEAGDQGFYRLVLEHTSDVVMRLNARWERLFVSPSCREMFGYTIEDINKTAPLALVHPDDRATVHTILSGLDLPAAPKRAIWRGVHRDGSLLWIEASYRRIVEDGGAVVILRDITQRKDAEEREREAREQWEQAARIDPLTGLPNRQAFLDSARRHLADGGELALFFIDLDRFNGINLTHGHAAGDATLRAIAARLLRETVREHNGPWLAAAHLGADEFGLLLRVTNGDSDIAARARDLIRLIDQPVPHGEITLDTSATIGIAVSARDGTDVDVLLRHADLAIAQARQSGGGGYRFYEPAMGEALARAAALKAELRPASRDGRIMPWFQPVLRLGDRGLAAFEVTARWDHPTRGLIEPAVFSSLAEEIGASAEILVALLTRACATAHAWPPGIRLSMTLTPHDLHDESLPAEVARVLAETGFDGKNLDIDIAENPLIRESRTARRVMDGLRALGLTVTLNHYGGGFSSLFQSRAPIIDRIRIDRSIVGALARDTADARHVAAIVGMARALDLGVMAEGIEDARSLERLAELGCDHGTGSAIHAPMPAAALPAYLNSLKTPPPSRTLLTENLHLAVAG